MRVAPNGDVFVVESGGDRIRVLRPSPRGEPRKEVFAAGLNAPFGISFYPPGDDPLWVYVANTNSVVRFDYASGDLKAQGQPETVVARLPNGFGHWTRDVVFSNDGSKMFVSVGSASNAADRLEELDASELAKWNAQHPPGAAWGIEADRADVLEFTPDGKNGRVFASGIRNCVGLAVSPNSDLWCSTNERDGLGDDVPATTSPVSRMAGSTAGPGIISAPMKIPVTAARGPISRTRSPCPMSCSRPIRLRSA
jgi:glucose/arabinose dehydrogenase